MSKAMHTIRVCQGLACQGNFSADLYDHALRETEGTDRIKVETSHCMNQCECGPNVVVDTEIVHQMTTAELDQRISLLKHSGK